MGKKIIFHSIVVLVLAVIAFSVFVFWDRSNLMKNETPETVAMISNENNPNGKVLGEQGSASSADASRMYASQNFRTPEITFGGDAIALPAGEQSVAPEIQDMRSELLTTKTDQQVKFLLSWRTSKLCQSSIDYTKEGQAEAKTVSEDGYGFIHSVEISPLNYSTSYAYTVTARDKWGNEIRSDKLAFYTGAPTVSIFNLLGGAFKDMFGWAGKK
ncbi:MAG: fibronectin type III domain-containing protein [Candidatus Moranbacteria bacterium]|nr:fibronectin type III domain-containing protein [Candidatus Moranbacteria bacterium]